MEQKRTQIRRIQIAATIGGLLLSSSSDAQQRPPTRVTLDRALQLARESSPLLQAARYRIDEARGDLTGASILLVNNPQVRASAGQRRATDNAETNVEFEVRFGQRFEIGGQRGDRMDEANARLRATEAAANDVQRVVELAIATSFYDALAARDRVQLRTDSRELAERLFQVATKRLERGAGVPLEVNTARIRRAEADRRLLAARSQERASLLRLKQLLGLPSKSKLTLQGELPKAALAQSDEVLVSRALKERPDLLQANQRIEVARASTKLADANAWPDISLGFSYGKEEQNNIFMGGLRTTIPLFNRNQGVRQRERATLRRRQAEQTALKLEVEAELRRELLAYGQARAGLLLYDAEVLRAQEESLQLLQRAFQAGDIGIPNVIVVQREVIESREGYLDVRLELARTRAAVLAAAHLPQTTTSQGKTP